MKNKIIISITALSVAFGLGRYTVSSSDIKTSSNTNTQDNKDVKTHEVVTTTKAKDGVVKTVKTIDILVTDKKNTEQVVSTEKTTTKPPVLNISILAANDFSKRTILPVYGLSVSKEFLGPITVGAFGLTSGTIGVNIGVNF